MRITVSAEPDIDELARVGLLGSNCTIWAVGLFDQSVVWQSQVITQFAGKAVHNDGAMQPKPGLAAWAVQLSRAGLSTTPKDFLESRP
jgi:hypothetical protein